MNLCGFGDECDDVCSSCVLIVKMGNRAACWVWE